MSMFDGRWHSYTEQTLGGGLLEPDDVFDLEVDPANGMLKPSSTHAGRPISGQVDEGNRKITIQDGPKLKYEGTLCVEEVSVGHPPRMINFTVGKFKLDPIAFRNKTNTLRARLALDQAQEEGTWVLTKP